MVFGAFAAMSHELFRFCKNMILVLPAHLLFELLDSFVKCFTAGVVSWIRTRVPPPNGVRSISSPSNSIRFVEMLLSPGNFVILIREVGFEAMETLRVKLKLLSL